MVKPSEQPKRPLPGQVETLGPPVAPGGPSPPLPTPRPSGATDATIPATPSDAPVAADAPAVALAGAPAPGPAPALPIPRSFGNYEIVDELARGGMGVIYRARQVGLDRLVALKVMLEGEFASRDTLERFHREARAAARLTHPAIVPIHEIGVVDGRPFFTMELVEGPPFDDFVAKQTPGPRTILEIVRQVAEGVAYAHSQGVIHRDLKPANILIDPSGRPHLLDFGLARDLRDTGSRTRTGLAFGTPAYMPPEQAAGHVHQIDERSDVYALGAILYHGFTGRPPFEGENAASVLQAVVTTDPPRPRSICRELHREIETIIRKAMAREKRDRYASAADLAEDLARFLDGRPILARPPGLAERAWRYLGRHRIAAATAVLAVALVSAGALHFLERLGDVRELDRLAAEARARLGVACSLPPDQADYAEWQRRVKESLGALDPVLRLDPTRAPVLRERGFAREVLGDLAGAAADFAEAARRDPRLADAPYHHARILLRLGKSESDEGRRLLQALAAGSGPYATIAQAHLALLARDPFQAVLLARHAIELYPELTDADPILARAYGGWFERFDQPRALWDLEKAIRLRPGDGELYAARARIHLELKHRREALADVRRAAARAPSSEVARLEVEALHLNARDDDALNKVNELSAREPAQLQTQLLRLDLLLLVKSREAKKVLAQLLLSASPSVLRRALDLVLAVDPDLVSREFEKAVSSLPAHFGTLEEGVDLAHLQVLFGAAARAQTTTSALLARYPDRPEAFWARSELLLAAGRLKEGMLLLGRALALAPEWSELYFKRAQVIDPDPRNLFKVMANPKKMFADLDRVLELAPANLEARAWRGTMRFLLNDEKGGADDFVEMALVHGYVLAEKRLALTLDATRGRPRIPMMNMVKSVIPRMIARTADRLSLRGDEFRRGNDLANAVSAYTLVLLLQPQRNDARIALARTYAKMGDQGAALEFLERAQREGYQNADAVEMMPELGPLFFTRRFRDIVNHMREIDDKPAGNPPPKDRPGGGPDPGGDRPH